MKRTGLRTTVLIALVLLLGTVVTAAYAAPLLITVDSGGGDDVGQYTSLAMNADGFAVISYYDVTNTNLKLAVCNDATCSSPTIKTEDLDGDVGQYTSLVLNASGYPVISYYDALRGDLRLVVCENATCSLKTMTTVDSDGDVGQYTSLVLNASGYPVISYYDVTNGDLKLAVCENATCSSKTITPVDTINDVGQYTSLALNADGYPVISYYDVTTSKLKMALCEDATCSSTIIRYWADSPAAQASSLALRANGNPVISYRGGDNALWVYMCNNPDCSGAVSNRLDHSSTIPNVTSLSLNSSGYPVISYYDSAAKNLMLALCRDGGCYDTLITTVASTGDVGNYSSLAMTASGSIAISYFDESTGDLMLALISTPDVLDHNLQASYSETAPSFFVVSFTVDVYNPGGDSDPDDVTNINNYWIVDHGDNGTLDTSSCGAGLAGDDSRILPVSVTYEPVTAHATLAEALPDGLYTLFVCGSTSIVDSDRFPLNGGSDYTFNFTVNAGAGSGSDPGNTAAAAALPATGFTPGAVTILPAQPDAAAYSSPGITLEISALGLSMPVVGVPLSGDGWDVTWLGRSAGYLEGSAFPTLAGNTVITGHVWDAANLPGPFAELKQLRYGDLVQIEAWGNTYTYEVRDSRIYWHSADVENVFGPVEDGHDRPRSDRPLGDSPSQYDWVTLLTCETYNPLNGEYLFRRAVQAVLISVD